MASVDADTRDTVTRLLHAARDGDVSAFDRLMSLVYTELKQGAVRELYREYADHAQAECEKARRRLAAYDAGGEPAGE